MLIPIFDRESVIVAAKKQFKKEFPKATVLVLGMSSYAEPQKILVGPREFKTKINILVKAFDKLDWDIVADGKKIQALEKKWNRLWPREYAIPEV